MSTVAPKVTAVIVSYNTRVDLLRCLDSLAAVGLPLEVVVVDNASADGSAEAVRFGHPAVRLVENLENVGFARASNQGLRMARAPYALLLNSDAVVTAEAVGTLAGVLDARPEVAVVGPRTLNADGTPQLSFGPDLTPMNEWRQRRLVRGVRRRDPQALRLADTASRTKHEPDWVSGSCFLARVEALAGVGFFDEDYFLYEEDVDLCMRLRQAGWRVVFTPAATIVHHLGRSMEQAPNRSRIEYHRSHLRYYRKHRGPFLTGLLRLYLAGLGTLSWILAAGPGTLRHERRRLAGAICRLGWS